MESSPGSARNLAGRLARYLAAVGVVLLMGLPVKGEENRTRRDPPRPAAPAPRVAPNAPIRPNPGTAEQARIEAACVRYRLVWGMDCPYENGSGANGVDPTKDVRRLGVQPPVKKK